MVSNSSHVAPVGSSNANIELAEAAMASFQPTVHVSVVSAVYCSLLALNSRFRSCKTEKSWLKTTPRRAYYTIVWSLSTSLHSSLALVCDGLVWKANGREPNRSGAVKRANVLGSSRMSARST